MKHFYHIRCDTDLDEVVIVSVSIYTLNYDKASFSKQGRRGIINFCKYELEPSSLLHCVYIFMKKSMYSRSIGNLSITIVIVFNQLGL